MTTNFQVTELDFDTIKSNLIAYLRGTSTFSDYDFSGSNLQALINILAYNTHYNGVLTNAAFNETFLDTAIKRGSVVSRAAEIGYVPKSSRSSFAVISLDIRNQLLQTPVVTLPQYYQFTSKVGNSTYSFYTLQDYSASASATYEYLFPAVNVYEGTKLVNSFLVSGEINQKFVIPNKGVDTNSIRVLVSDSANSTVVTKYIKFSDLQNSSSAAKVYYLEENAGGFYELYFGDGVVSNKLSVGNVVTVDYIVPSGSAANVSSMLAQTFIYSSGITGVDGTILINTVSNSGGGSLPESIEEIKFNSKLSFERQNRTITAKDFESYVLSTYGNIKSVSVYGGEDAAIAAYGKVFLSIQAATNESVGESTKAAISADLRQYMNLAVTPVFLDPDFIFVTIISNIKYNKDKTALSSTSITSLVKDAIQNYFDTEISKFKGNFYYSRLSNLISDVDSSIVSNQQSIRLQKRLALTFDTLVTNTKLNFGASLQNETLSSNVFYFVYKTITYSAFLSDKNGIVRIQSFTDGSVLLDEVGVVDYNLGIVTLNNVVISGYRGDEVYLKLSCSARQINADITPAKNQILVLDNSTYSSTTNVQTGLSIFVANES